MSSIAAEIDTQKRHSTQGSVENMKFMEDTLSIHLSHSNVQIEFESIAVRNYLRPESKTSVLSTYFVAGKWTIFLKTIGKNICFF